MSPYAPDPVASSARSLASSAPSSDCGKKKTGERRRRDARNQLGTALTSVLDLALTAHNQLRQAHTGVATLALAAYNQLGEKKLTGVMALALAARNQLGEKLHGATLCIFNQNEYQMLIWRRRRVKMARHLIRREEEGEASITGAEEPEA